MGRKKTKPSSHDDKESAAITTDCDNKEPVLMSFVGENEKIKLVPEDLNPGAVKKPKRPKSASWNSNKPLQCEVCTKTLANKYCLENHMKLVHPAEPKFVPCDLCDLKFANESRLELHKANKHMDPSLRPHACPHCEARFTNKFKFKAHVEKHSGVRTVTCGLCDLAFYYKFELVSHMKARHLNIASFKCTLCEVGFKRKIYLKKHMLQVHLEAGSTPNCFPCRFCAKVYLSASGLSEHEASHSQSNRPLCMICGKTFSRDHTLQMHLAAHSNPPGLACGSCGRKFRYRSGLRRHEAQIHGEKQTIVCQVCGKLFTNKDAFRGHLKKHVRRGQLAELPPNKREQRREAAKVNKVQKLLKDGVDIERILESCRVDIRQSDSKRRYRQLVSKPESVDGGNTRAVESKWTLHLDGNGNDTSGDGKYQIISRDFRSIVRSSTNGVADFTTNSLGGNKAKILQALFRIKHLISEKGFPGVFCGKNIVGKSRNDNVHFKAAVIVDIPSVVNVPVVADIPEEVPELKPDLLDIGKFLAEEMLDAVNFDLSEDVFGIERRLEENYANTLRPLQVLGRGSSEDSNTISLVVRPSTVDFETALNNYDANVSSMLPELGIAKAGLPRDFREFQTHAVKDLSFDELCKKIELVLYGRAKMLWIDNVTNEVKEVELEIPPAAKEMEAESDDCDDPEAMLQTESETELEPNGRKVEANATQSNGKSRQSHKNSENKRKKKSKLPDSAAESSTASDESQQTSSRSKRKMGELKKSTRKKSEQIGLVSKELHEDEDENNVEQMDVQPEILKRKRSQNGERRKSKQQDIESEEDTPLHHRLSKRKSKDLSDKEESNAEENFLHEIRRRQSKKRKELVEQEAIEEDKQLRPSNSKNDSQVPQRKSKKNSRKGVESVEKIETTTILGTLKELETTILGVLKESKKRDRKRRQGEMEAELDEETRTSVGNQVETCRRGGRKSRRHDEKTGELTVRYREQTEEITEQDMIGEQIQNVVDEHKVRGSEDQYIVGSEDLLMVCENEANIEEAEEGEAMEVDSDRWSENGDVGGDDSEDEFRPEIEIAEVSGVIEGAMSESEVVSKASMPKKHHTLPVNESERVTKSEKASKPKTYSTVPVSSQQTSLKRVKKEKTSKLEKEKASKPQRHYMCHHCDKVFTYKHHLKSHIYDEHGFHPAGWKHSCTECGKEFCSQTSLNDHKGRIHAKGTLKYYCELCGLGLPHKATLRVHIEMVHLKIKNFACHLCEWTFYSRPQLRYHIRTHTKEKPHLCHLCPKRYYRPVQLKKHLRLHAAGVNYTCHLCARTFRCKRTIALHLERHENKATLLEFLPADNKSTTCPICNRSLASHFSLLRHIERMHSNPKGRTLKRMNKSNPRPSQPPTEPKAFACPHCERSFDKRRNYRDHIRRHHTDRMRNYCPLCGRRLLNELTVMRHMVLRHPDNCENVEDLRRNVNSQLSRLKEAKKKFKCGFCPRKMTSQEAIDRHMLVKHDYKPGQAEELAQVEAGSKLLTALTTG